MLKEVDELEKLLGDLVVEHRRLLVLLDRQHAAMRSLKTIELEEINRLAEASRARIATLDARRTRLAAEIARACRFVGELTVGQLAELFPQKRLPLLKLRDELRAVITQLSRHVAVGSRVAGALVGHLNTVVRLIAGAVERAGIYTRSGIPQASQRIGMMEAVG